MANKDSALQWASHRLRLNLGFHLEEALAASLTNFPSEKDSQTLHKEDVHGAMKSDSNKKVHEESIQSFQQSMFGRKNGQSLIITS